MAVKAGGTRDLKPRSPKRAVGGAPFHLAFASRHNRDFGDAETLELNAGNDMVGPVAATNGCTRIGRSAAPWEMTRMTLGMI